MSTVLVGTIGLVNVGAIVYLVRMVIAPIAETVGSLKDSVKELYESRNDHERKIVRIETTHEIKGCDAPYSKGKP